MKTRAILLAAAAVLLAAPAFAAHSDNTDNNNDNKKHQTEQQTGQATTETRHEVHQDNRLDRRAAAHQDRVDARQAERRLDRRMTTANINEFRANTTASRRYHYGSAWNAPRDWRYTRYSYGQRMPNYYYGSSYWIIDFGGFGLYAPPMNYRWIRYGSDAILVDVRTGEVIRVEYNMFY